MGTPTHLRYYRDPSSLPSSDNEINQKEEAQTTSEEQKDTSTFKTSIAKEASSSSTSINASNKGSGNPSSSATTTNPILNTPFSSKGINNAFTSRRTFAFNNNTSPSTSTPISTRVLNNNEASSSLHKRTPSNETSISSGTIGSNGSTYASVAASKVAPSSPIKPNGITSNNHKKIDSDVGTDTIPSSYPFNDVFRATAASSTSMKKPFVDNIASFHHQDQRDSTPFTSTPSKSTKLNLNNNTTTSNWKNGSSSTPSTNADWTAPSGPSFFSPGHAAFKHTHNGNNGGDHSFLASSNSLSSNSFRPFETGDNLKGGFGELRTTAFQYSNSAALQYTSPAKVGNGPNASFSSLNSMSKAAGNGNGNGNGNASTLSSGPWYDSFNSGGGHNRSYTQNTDSSNLTSEGNTSLNSSIFDHHSYNQYNSADTSYNSKLSSSVGTSNTSISPYKHARKISDDGSLFQFDGLADLSIDSVGAGQGERNGRPSLRAGDGNVSLSSIPDLILDNSSGAEGDVKGKGKTGTNSSTLLFNEGERSDLDKLYQKVNVRDRENDHQARVLPPGLTSSIFHSAPSHAQGASSGYIEDPNFSRAASDAYMHVKLNNEDQPTRYLFVSGLPLPSPEDGATMVNEIMEAIKVMGQPRGIYVRHVIHTGCLVLSFHDLRHAATCRANIIRDSRRYPAWGYRQLSAEYIERDEVVKLAEGKFFTGFLSLGEGKLTLSAHVNFQYEGLKAYFSALGDVKTFNLDPESSGETVNWKRSYLIEYFDDRCASKAYVDITQAENDALKIDWHNPSSLTTYLVEESSNTQADLSKNKAARPPLPRAFPSYPEDRFQRYKKTAWSELSNSPSPASFPLPEGFKSATVLPAASSASSPSNQQQGGNSSLAHLGYVPNDPSRNSTAQWGLIRDDPVPDNNLIRFDRIISGEDQRTSCILRNLPNRMTQLELMENLDEVVPREYDFIYLRFDFNSGSNCGYSFVNFVSSDALLRFWKARLGTFWDQDNSRKLCMGGMAAIQGKAALVERFRNSSVMDAKEEYRPKIFYSSGPMRGLPEPFPMSNNALRKAKSAYATATYGLYGKRPSGGFRHVML